MCARFDGFYLNCTYQQDDAVVFGVWWWGGTLIKISKLTNPSAFDLLTKHNIGI